MLDGTLDSHPKDELKIEFLIGMWNLAKNLAETELRLRHPELGEKAGEVMRFNLERRFGVDPGPIEGLL